MNLMFLLIVLIIHYKFWPCYKNILMNSILVCNQVMVVLAYNFNEKVINTLSMIRELNESDSYVVDMQPYVVDTQ